MRVGPPIRQDASGARFEVLGCKEQAKGFKTGVESRADGERTSSQMTSSVGAFLKDKESRFDLLKVVGT